MKEIADLNMQHDRKLLLANIIALLFDKQYSHADRIFCGLCDDTEIYYKSVADKAKLLRGLWHRSGAEYIFEGIPPKVADFGNKVFKHFNRIKMRRIGQEFSGLEQKLYLTERIDEETEGHIDNFNRDVKYPYTLFSV